MTENNDSTIDAHTEADEIHASDLREVAENDFGGIAAMLGDDGEGTRVWQLGDDGECIRAIETNGRTLFEPTDEGEFQQALEDGGFDPATGQHSEAADSDSTYITIPRDGTDGDCDTYPADTAEQIVEASRALADAGIESAPVYAGDAPDSVATGAIVFAAEAGAEITRDQIEQLRTEAGSAGDAAQVAICDRALTGDSAAISECASVIADAASMAVAS